MIPKQDWVCKDCIACEQSLTGYICSFENNGIDLDYNVSTKKVCMKFIPEQYIKSLNYDTN